MDRLFNAIASGHWSFRTVAYLAGVLLAVACVPVLLVSLVVVPAVLLGAPPGAAAACGGVAAAVGLVGRVVAIKRKRPSAVLTRSTMPVDAAQASLDAAI